MAYDNPDDTHAVELRARLARDGLGGVLRDVCGIRADELLAALVQHRYEALMERAQV
jgi:hypothetical protein